MAALRSSVSCGFSTATPIMILFGLALAGCAGTTAVRRQHHLLQRSLPTASVFFMRPKQGFMGVRGKPVGIQLDGEHLLDLSIGEYTFLNLPQGEYNMLVTSTTLEGPDNAMVETSREFTLNTAGADSVYLLFTLEEGNFWERVRQNLSDQYESGVDKLIGRLDTITVPLGKHVSFDFVTPGPQKSAPRPGIGYKVESLSREAASEAASGLEPVEGAEHSPLRK